MKKKLSAHVATFLRLKFLNSSKPQKDLLDEFKTHFIVANQISKSYVRKETVGLLLIGDHRHRAIMVGFYFKIVN